MCVRHALESALVHVGLLERESNSLTSVLQSLGFYTAGLPHAFSHWIHLQLSSELKVGKTNTQDTPRKGWSGVLGVSVPSRSWKPIGALH